MTCYKQLNNQNLGQDTSNEGLTAPKKLNKRKSNKQLGTIILIRCVHVYRFIGIYIYH